MIATSPMIRILTSWASRFEIPTGRAVCVRKPSRSTSEPSGLLHMKSSARSSLNRRTSEACTDRM